MKVLYLISAAKVSERHILMFRHEHDKRGNYMSDLRRSYNVIEDGYGSNPLLLKRSLAALAELPGRKIAILGDLGDMHKASAGLHRELGRECIAKGIDILCCVGELGAEIGHAAEKTAEKTARKNTDAGKCEVRYYMSREMLLGELSGILEDGDNILVKGAPSTNLRSIIDMLKAQQI